ncbi:MAG TPA: hypothetical protein VFY14_04090 [Streptomyces sp.]|nr:hypothetical protein [Streptomyces sp.]
MTRRTPGRIPGTASPAATPRIDYSGAVYGSLLAASVIVGAGTLGPFPRFELVLLLLCTGGVFWAAHVYARLFGAWVVDRQPDWHGVRRVCADERPIVEAVLPPAAAVAVSPLLGLGVQATGWLALAVAVSGQVGWAAAAAVRAGASGRLTLATSLVNLFLGLVIVATKAALGH